MQIPTVVEKLDRQPVEFIEVVAGIYFRSVFLEKEGTIIPQHVHSHDHATYVGSGAVRLWVDEIHNGDYFAGQAIEIKAGRKHLFQSLYPNTRLACVHDTNSASLIKEVGD